MPGRAGSWLAQVKDPSFAKQGKLAGSRTIVHSLPPVVRLLLHIAIPDEAGWEAPPPILNRTRAWQLSTLRLGIRMSVE